MIWFNFGLTITINFNKEIVIGTFGSLNYPLTV